MKKIKNQEAEAELNSIEEAEAVPTIEENAVYAAENDLAQSEALNEVAAEPVPVVEPAAPAEPEPVAPDLLVEDPDPVVEEAVAAEEEETPIEEEAAPAPIPQKKAAKPAKKAPVSPKPVAPAPKTYSRQEKKLRKKYKLDKDALLSANSAVPGFILAQGEQVIRSYHCLASAKGPGTVCLTNRRLLVNADERSEVSIEQLTGIKFSRYTKFFFGKFFFALLFTAIAALSVLLPIIEWKFNIPNITGETKLWAEILCYVGAGISFFIALPLWFKIVRKTFYFYIFAHQDAPFIACKNSGFSKREAKGKVAASMVASAGKESEKAARELGALIIEVKEGRFDE